MQQQETSKKWSEPTFTTVNATKSPNDVVNVVESLTTVDNTDSIVNNVCRSKDSDVDKFYTEKYEHQLKCHFVDKSDEVNDIPNCGCDIGSHVCCKIQELGQSKWLEYSKK